MVGWEGGGGRQCERGREMGGVGGGRRAGEKGAGEKRREWERKAGLGMAWRGKDKPANHEAESAYVTGDALHRYLLNFVMIFASFFSQEL